MEKKLVKEGFDGKKVEILGETYEEGMPQEKGEWRGKLKKRDQMLKYIRSAERYWYSDDWFGSEKRKTKA